MDTTQAILQRIRQSSIACTLYALRSWAIREGKWVEAIHEQEWADKFEKITGRWK